MGQENSWDLQHKAYAKCTNQNKDNTSNVNTEQILPPLICGTLVNREQIGNIYKYSQTAHSRKQILPPLICGTLVSNSIHDTRKKPLPNQAHTR